MSRQAKIGFITNFYPLFIVGHLLFGNWSRWSQVIFNIMPIAVFGSLFAIWRSTSHIRLNVSERVFLGYLILMLTTIYLYYVLCIFGDKGWVDNHNWQFAIFIGLTVIFYLYSYVYKWRQ